MVFCPQLTQILYIKTKDGIRTLTRQLPTKLFRVPSLLLPISPKIPHAESIQPDPLSSSSSLLHCGHRRL
ncbi:hypothetical protein L1887_18635 [Cichorium endivia]|nr:hypothetical protein L1887_18635 [Cichorium endivia]